MIYARTIVVVCILLLLNFQRSKQQLSIPSQSSASGAEAEAWNFLLRHDRETSEACNNIMDMSWKYLTNITRLNKLRMARAQMDGSEIRRKNWLRAQEYPWRTYRDPILRRMFKRATVIGAAALPINQRREYSRIMHEMKTTYTEARICQYDPSRTTSDIDLSSNRQNVGREEFEIVEFQSLDRDDTSRSVLSINNDLRQYCVPTYKIEPDLTRIMAESRNPNELLYVWKAWRDVAGKPIQQNYLRFVDLYNEAARLNGFENGAELMKSEYEDPQLEEELDRVWEEVKPLYEQLHTYVRTKLMQRYDEDIFSPYRTLPAHLLGNMWAQNWASIYDITTPYPRRQSMDVTRALRNQGYSAFRIFRTAEDFFISLGLGQLPMSFWFGSMLQRPSRTNVDCHASAWDFCNRRDYRIKQCTEITMTDFITAHHEMGHIYYALAYKNQPLLFRDGANPGFHEAIGEAIALSVMSPKHLENIGLLNPGANRYEDDINSLFATALDKVAFLPFGLLVDKWRWKVLSGEINAETMNDYWWQLRVTYQGISPPLFRENSEFDPGAKYHIPANIPYVRYFVGHILQFQIHEELCKAAGQTSDFSKCDIQGSTEAGSKLWEMMRMGKSVNWRSALSTLTDGRSTRLDAKPLLRYFKRLNDWLENENRDKNIGWDTDGALFEISGATINTSSAVFIGIVVLILIILLIIIGSTFYACRKVRRHYKTDPIPT